MFHQETMRIDDPSDNGGRGWRRLARDEVADLAYLAIRLASRGIRSDLAGRNAAKADEAARKLSEAVSARLAAYSDVWSYTGRHRALSALPERRGRNWLESPLGGNRTLSRVARCHDNC